MFHSLRRPLFLIGITQLLALSAFAIDLQTTETGRPYASSTKGLTMFRGNPTRSWYGTGPLPLKSPRVLWRYPDKPMCSKSTSLGKTKEWCGNGWTGQPAIWERPDGRTEIIVGTYDKGVHFIDAETGRATRAPFITGDIIKGSVTIDPDGFPLLYFGSRDGKLRILALDRERPEELWAYDAKQTKGGVWNDDWDGNPLIQNDYLLEGGENSWFYVFRLFRHYERGQVFVRPEKIVEMPGWTDELLKNLPDKMVSIENSVATYKNTAYLANSGGLITGVDLSRIEQRRAQKTFQFWAGDDIDASIVIDDDGSLFVAAEDERGIARAREVGQLMKLDPRNSNQPLVWSLASPKGPDGNGGFWATPALDSRNRVLYVPTHSGELWAVDADRGTILWRDNVGPHAWSSPALIDGFLLQATCSPGGLKLYDVSVRNSPKRQWSVKLPSGSCIESTPAVWRGKIYAGARDGFIYAFGE